MANSKAVKEISQTLEYFNQMQDSSEEPLEPVDKWSSDIVEKLDLKEDRGILSVDPEEALQRILPVAKNENQKKALSQFFSQHLSELKCLSCKDEIECIISEFSESHPPNEQLTRLVESFRKLQSVLTDNEKFEKCVGELQNLHQLQKAFADIYEAKNESADSETLMDLANELLNLSPVMYPIPKGVLKIMRDTNLLEFAFNKISLSKITEICQTDDGLSTEFSALERLRLLAVCDSRARYADRRSPTVMDDSAEDPAELDDEDSDEEESSEPLHPMDVLYASFLCCDVEAKQFLCQRLFACKLAFPFLYVNEFDHLVQSDWALADIVVEFKDSKGEMLRICLGASSIMQLEDSHKPQVRRLPVVSFLRIGELKVSKSKILSNLLGSSQEDTFFNRDCTQGKVKRICSSGLVEAAVSFEIPHSPYLALNLRGNAMDYGRQTGELARMSDCCVLFGGIDEFAKVETKNFVEKLTRSKDPKTTLIIALEPTREAGKKLAAQTFNSLPFKKVLAYRDTLSVGDIVSKVRSNLKEILSHNLRQSEAQSSSTYEDSSKAALIWAQKFYQHLANEDFSRAKILPVQSLTASRAGENVQKGYFRRLQEFVSNEADPESISAAKQQLYQSQVSAYNEHRSACFYNFREWLYHLQENEASASVKTYLHAVKLILDEHSFNTLPKLKEQLLLAKFKLAALENQGDLQSKMKDLEDNVKQAEKNLTDSSIDLNSLFRELGLLFEAHSNINSDFPESLNKLPCVFASLLLSGVPLELLDGTAANISMDWISTVLLECKRQVGDKKLFVVSVLGTQSTGKSTLLNTMFGLRLPVSTGRCTRGAFLQLVHVDKRSQLLFDYLAVIDTEGLRAVELGIDNHFNDNAFATLVIGLADVTLITVNGEDSAEMREVLPIVIQAFIQMNQVNKDLNLKRKCLFAHQNLGDPVAHAKLQNEFSARQAELDKFTEEAARKAGLSGVKSFSDIISFSPETDVFLLPSLWHGNPPSAPVNIEFSEKVCKLKQHLIKLSTDPQIPLLSFQDFACRIDDVFSAVLTQDFVLSFRNSIVNEAFNDLETEFKEIVLEFKKATESEVKNLLTSQKKHGQSQQGLDCLRQKLRSKISSMVEAAFTEAEKKLNSYFQESKRHQYINQWQSDRMAALSKVKEKMQKKLSDHLNEFIQVQQLEFRKKEGVEKARKILAESALELANQSERHPLSDEQIEKRFEELWNSKIADICQDSEASVSFIKEKLKKHAAEQFPNDRDTQSSIFTSEISGTRTEIEALKKLSDIVQFQNTYELYKVGGFRGYIQGHEKYHNSVLAAVKSVLASIRQLLTEITEEHRSFWDSDAQKVIEQVCREFDSASKRLSSKKISLTEKLKAAVAVYACRMAYETFKQMEIQFSKQYSLKSRLDADKTQMLQLFRDRVKKVLQDSTTAANYIINALKEVLPQLLKKKMDSLVPSKCLEHFKASLRNKTRLIKKLLQHAMDSSDQELILSYIRSPTKAAFGFVEMQVEEFLFETEVGDSLQYISIAKTEFLDPSKRAIHDALGLAKRCTSLENWLREFCETLSIPDVALDMSIMQSPEVAFQDVMKSLGQKAPMVIDEIFDGLKQSVKKGGESKNYHALVGMKEAYQKVKSYLWGCQHCCPLCNEPCMRMEADHVNGDKNLHRCMCHRPMGLTGDKLESASELAPYSCGYFATPFSRGPFAKIFQGWQDMRFRCGHCSMEAQIQPPEEEANSEAGSGAAAIAQEERTLHKCSDYKDCFPDWDIQPTFWAPVPDFWKWIAWNHREALLSTSKVYAAIPEKWKEVTLAKARQSLDKVFAE